MTWCAEFYGPLWTFLREADNADREPAWHLPVLSAKKYILACAQYLMLQVLAAALVCQNDKSNESKAPPFVRRSCAQAQMFENRQGQGVWDLGGFFHCVVSRFYPRMLMMPQVGRTTSPTD